MKILHTSDWHLGRSFHGVDVLDVQVRALDEIVGWVRDQGIHAVLVSGDVYDRAQPRTDVVEALNRGIARIRDAGAYVVITSGNHDSPVRLGFGAGIMEHGGVFLRTRRQQAHHPVVLREVDGQVTARVQPRDLPGAGDGGPEGRGHESGASRVAEGDADAALARAGEAADTEVCVYGVPYLEPRSVAPELGTEATHQAVLAATMERIRSVGRPGERSVVMAHAFVTGAEPSDSERVIDAGGLGTVGASVFDGTDYTALGHLHGRQAVTGSVRYSGSPVAYSFSETGHTKGAWLVEITGTEPVTVTALDHAHGLDLATLRGSLEELLTSERYEDVTGAWCQVVLTDPHRPEAAMERVRTRFPRALTLAWEPEGGRPRAEVSYATRVRRARSPEQLCGEFFDHVRQRPVDAAERAELTDVVGAATARLDSDEGTR